MILFLLIYVILPALFLSGLACGMKSQLNRDADQSLLDKPNEEWCVAVLRAKMRAENKGAN